MSVCWRWEKERKENSINTKRTVADHGGSTVPSTRQPPDSGKSPRPPATIHKLFEISPLPWCRLLFRGALHQTLTYFPTLFLNVSFSFVPTAPLNVKNKGEISLRSCPKRSLLRRDTLYMVPNYLTIVDLRSEVAGLSFRNISQSRTNHK
mgnify:CR=1 FL=1